MLKNSVLKALAWAGLVAVCGVVALAQNTPQDTAPAAAPAPAVESRSDGQIEMDVVHALDASKALKNDLITAATIQSEVTLSGTVSSEASSELAESIASRVAGVTKVNNNLKVGDPKAAADAAEQAPADGQQEESMAPPPPPPPADGPQAAPAQSPYPGQAQGQPDTQTPQSQSEAQSAQPQPAPPAQPQNGTANPQFTRTRPRYEAPTGPVTVSQGTLLQLRTNEPVRSKRAKDGTPVEFTLIHDVAVGGVLAIPRGATVHGVVTEIKKARELAGSPELALTLTSLDLGGQSYPLQTDQFKVKGPGKGAQTANDVVGGTLLGTMIGCIAGRGVGCAIGAGAGAAAGTAASAATPGPGVWIPAEALVDFHLAAPVTVTPVSRQEAARLAQGLYQGGPTLYRRPYYPYAGPYAAGYPYAYGYPPVYYRPYYMVGGYYYWR
ncbi:MAG: BON domain-containing protein [Terracidiphilus sp.]|jgi:hypothetical protein